MPTWLLTLRRAAQAANALVLAVGAWAVTQGYTGPAFAALTFAGLNLLALRRPNPNLAPRLIALVPAVLTVIYGCLTLGIAAAQYATHHDSAQFAAFAIAGLVFFAAGSLTMTFTLLLAQLAGLGLGNERP